MVKIVVSGAMGRMGKRITELAQKDAGLGVVAGVEIKDNPGLKIVNDLNKIKDEYDCIIEFTTPEATLKHVATAKRLKKAIRLKNGF